MNLLYVSYKNFSINYFNVSTCKGLWWSYSPARRRLAWDSVSTLVETGCFLRLSVQNSSCVFWDRNRYFQARHTAFPNPNEVFFLPKHKQTISTALSLYKTENLTQRIVTFQHICGWQKCIANIYSDDGLFHWNWLIGCMEGVSLIILSFILSLLLFNVFWWAFPKVHAFVYCPNTTHI